MVPANPCDIPVLGSVCDLPGQAVGSVTSSAWEGLVGAFTDSAGQATRLLLTFWTTVPTPDLARSDGPVQFLRSSTSWYTGALAVTAFLLGAARIALTHRGEHAAQLGQGMIRLIAATFLGVPATAALLVAGDSYSDWVLDRATGGQFGARVTALGGFTQLTSFGTGSALLFLLALLALAASVGQMLMLFVRSAMLVVLVGVFPLSAAMSSTEAGNQWFRRSTGWLVAFVLYKPTAATVYAAGFISSSSNDPVSVVTGVFLIGLSVVTLPALLRLTVPATAAVAAGGGGGAAAAAGGALATGAVALGGVRAGQFGSGGARTSGPGPAGGGGAGLRSPSGSRSTAAAPGPGNASRGAAGGTGTAASAPTGTGRSAGAGSPAGGTPASGAAASGAAASGGPSGAVRAAPSAATVVGRSAEAAGRATGSAQRAAEGAAGESGQ